MTPLNLENRIKKSRKAIQDYPEWARNGCKFQGGGVLRSVEASERSKPSKK
jgi:hypothetical protein